MSGTGAAHRRELARLPLPEDAREPLALYLDVLARWNERVNLTGARSAEARVAILVAPVIAAAAHVAPGRLLDIGSGNGSPGLVLAFLRPDLDATLLEPRLHRWAFLREAAREAGRPDVTVWRCRHDEYAGPPADTITIRALRVRLASLSPCLAPRGRVLVWGRPLSAEDGFEARPGPTGIAILERR